MKRALFSILTLIIASCITSCKKDFTCSCSKIYKNSTGNNIREYSVKTYRDSRSGAEEKCKAQVESGSDDTGNYSLNCQIEC
ncbi:MAG: hypothetical protein V4565_01880 [Bacteroidota bacterium]